MDINIVGYLIGNIIRVFLLYKVFMIFYCNRKANEIVEFTAYAAFFTVNSLMYITFNIPVVNIIVNIAGMFAITFLYEGQIWKKILVVLLQYGFELVHEVTMLVLMNAKLFELLGNNSYIEMYQYIFMNIIRYPIVLAFDKIIRIKNGDNIKAFYWIRLTAMTIITCILTLIITASNCSNYIILSGLIGLFIINLITFSLYDQIVKIKDNEIHEIELKNQNEMYREQLELLNNNISKTKAVRHDMKNHIGAINCLIVDGRIAEAKEYIAHLSSELNINEDKVRTGNTGIDAVLNYLYNKTEQMGVDVKFNIKISDNVHIETIDFMTVLGNLMDNAITATLSSDGEKCIIIKIVQKENSILINIENPYKYVLKQKNKLISTKQNTIEHGYGLENVNKVVRKYSGQILLLPQDNIFVAEVLLNEL